MPDSYRVLVTGSRDWADEQTLRAELCRLRYEHASITVVHGACPTGADAQAARWVSNWPATGFGGVAEEAHPAKWVIHGKRADFIRNRHMVAAGADICLAFIGPCRKRSCTRPQPHGSHSATDCADTAEAAGITVTRFEATP